MPYQRAIAVLVEMETDKLKRQLREYPDQIMNVKYELRGVRETLEDAKLVRQEAEANLIVEIACDINPSTGKPAYSNAETRNAELLKRKSVDPEYKAADANYKEAEAGASNLQYELERLQDQFKALRYVVDLSARELAFMAADPNDEQQAEHQQF